MEETKSQDRGANSPSVSNDCLEIGESEKNWIQRNRENIQMLFCREMYRGAKADEVAGCLQEKVRELEADLAETRAKSLRDSEASARAVSRAKVHAAELSEELETANALADERDLALHALEVHHHPNFCLCPLVFLTLALPVCFSVWSGTMCPCVGSKYGKFKQLSKPG